MANKATEKPAVNSQAMRTAFRGNLSTINPQAGARTSAGNAAIMANVANVVYEPVFLYTHTFKAKVVRLDPRELIARAKTKATACRDEAS
jgi:hypothetical protein